MAVLFFIPSVPTEPLTWTCSAYRPELRLRGNWKMGVRGQAPSASLVATNTHRCPRCLQDANRTPLCHVQSLWRKAGFSEYRLPRVLCPAPGPQKGGGEKPVQLPFWQRGPEKPGGQRQRVPWQVPPCRQGSRSWQGFSSCSQRSPVGHGTGEWTRAGAATDHPAPSRPGLGQAHIPLKPSRHRHWNSYSPAGKHVAPFWQGWRSHGELS